jgi:hypothetical protein
MHQGTLVFAQLMVYLPLNTFRRCVADHNGEHKVKDFSCLDQFFAMAFAQLTYRESLRDIEVNLRAQARRLYHMGFRCQTISRNTLANANATRPWQIYADFAQHLIGLARPLYVTEPFGLELDAAVYAFDASTIDLCLSVFDRAQLRLEYGDLLVSEGGDVGRSCMWAAEIEHCYFQNSVNRVRARDGHSNRYLYYWMSTVKDKGYIDVLCNKSTIAHFTAEKVAAVKTSRSR